MTIHTDKLRWLLWLRWKLFTRSFTRSGGVGQIIGAIVLVFFLVPFLAGVAILTFFAYRILPAPANEEILFLVLTGVFLMWIVLPLLEFSGNEGLDISKLTPFPLTRAEIMSCLVISTLLDIPMLGLVLIFAAVVAGFAITLPVALLALLVMLVFYVQVVGMSQLVLALLARTLQSRRFRDVSVIIVILFSSLFGLFCQVINRLVIGNGQNFSPDALKQLAFSSYLQWLPPGMAARSIQQAVHGNWLASSAWLLGLLGVTLLALYLWQIVVERSLSSPETGGGRRRTRQHKLRAFSPPVPSGDRKGPIGRPQGFQTDDDEGPHRATARVSSDDHKGSRRTTAVVPSGDHKGPHSTQHHPRPYEEGIALAEHASVLRRIFPQQITAITAKDLKYIRRDPQLAAMAFQSLFSIIYLLIVPLLFSGTGRISFGFGSWLVLYAPIAVFLSMISFSLNSLGMDRQSLTMLFLFPVPPQRILWGKNLAVFLLGLVELVLLVGVAALVTQGWKLALPAFIAGLAGMGVVLGCGNFSSVFFPQYMPQMQRGFRATGLSSQNGCARSLMGLAILLVTVFLLLPVVAAIFLPLLFQIQWVWSITLPVSVLYGLAFHQVVTRLVAPRILEKAPEILAITTRE